MRAITPTRRQNAHLGDDSDLNLSNIDATSTYVELLTMSQDLKAKLSAARLTNEQYEEKVRTLKANIEELQVKAEETMQILEDHQGEIADENDSLRERLNSLPDAEFLTEQTEILQQEGEKTVFEDIDLAPFIELGLLRRGERVEVLKRRLQQWLKIVNEPDVISYRLPQNQRNKKRQYNNLKTFADGFVQKKKQNKELELAESEFL